MRPTCARGTRHIELARWFLLAAALMLPLAVALGRVAWRRLDPALLPKPAASDDPRVAELLRRDRERRAANGARNPRPCRATWPRRGRRVRGTAGIPSPPPESPAAGRTGRAERARVRARTRSRGLLARKREGR